MLRSTQCYKCWAWGHIQRYCQKQALCGRCGTKAHGEGGRAGEAHCPTHQGTAAYRCAGCGEDHPAWARECPRKQNALATAREAYQYRPRTFEPAAQPTIRPTTTATQPTQPTQPTGPTHPTDPTDGFQQVRTRKRARSTTPVQTQTQTRTRRASITVDTTMLSDDDL